MRSSPLAPQYVTSPAPTSVGSAGGSSTTAKPSTSTYGCPAVPTTRIVSTCGPGRRPRVAEDHDPVRGRGPVEVDRSDPHAVDPDLGRPSARAAGRDPRHLAPREAKGGGGPRGPGAERGAPKEGARCAGCPARRPLQVEGRLREPPLPERGSAHPGAPVSGPVDGPHGELVVVGREEPDGDAASGWARQRDPLPRAAVDAPAELVRGDPGPAVIGRGGPRDREGRRPRDGGPDARHGRGRGRRGRRRVRGGGGRRVDEPAGQRGERREDDNRAGGVTDAHAMLLWAARGPPAGRPP